MEVMEGGVSQAREQHMQRPGRGCSSTPHSLWASRVHGEYPGVAARGLA